MRKRALIHHVKLPTSDIFQTPPEAIFPILKYIPQNINTIWECCDPGWSIITHILKQTGYNVISTDKQTGFDFLKHKPNFDFDMILTNPPFSLKSKFIKKCYEYGKPFALLVPMTTLEGRERFDMFKKHGINVIVMNQRINYVRGKKGAWFASVWIFWDKTNNNNLYFETLPMVDDSNYSELISLFLDTKKTVQQRLFS